jgi:hypothetical protein
LNFVTESVAGASDDRGPFAPLDATTSSDRTGLKHTRITPPGRFWGRRVPG